MKRSASAAGLNEPGDGGVGLKTAKSVGGAGSDVGGSSPPLSPMSPPEDASPTASDGGIPANKSPQDLPKFTPSQTKGGKIAATGKKPSAPKVVLASPVVSDDEGEGKGRGGDKGGPDEDEEEEERLENMEFGKYHKSSDDTDRMQQVLNKFTPEQMSRYECYRRSGFQRANMRRLLGSVAGCPISIPMTIVMSGISKMFIGELVEVGRIVMTERNDVGPIRPCHVREAYRRLKLEGKVPLRGRTPLFR